MTTVGPPVIEYGTTSSYERIWRDVGLGGPKRVTFYRPIAPEGWFIVGHYAQGDHEAPTAPSTTVWVDPASEDPAQPVLVPPTGFQRLWTERGSENVHEVALWAPTPPPDYVALGMVATQGHHVPDAGQVRCILARYVKPTTFGPLIWRDHGSTSPYPVSVYSIAGVSSFYVQDNDQPPVGMVYAPD